jgi:hypothetical protein
VIRSATRNPTHASGWMLHIRPTRTMLHLSVFALSSNSQLASELGVGREQSRWSAALVSRLNLKHPPTGVGGISLWCLPRWYQRKSHFQLRPVCQLIDNATCLSYNSARLNRCGTSRISPDLSITYSNARDAPRSLSFARRVVDSGARHQKLPVFVRAAILSPAFKNAPAATALRCLQGDATRVVPQPYNYIRAMLLGRFVGEPVRGRGLLARAEVSRSLTEQE